MYTILVAHTYVNYTCYTYICILYNLNRIALSTGFYHRSFNIQHDLFVVKTEMTVTLIVLFDMTLTKTIPNIYTIYGNFLIRNYK